VALVNNDDLRADPLRLALLRDGDTSRLFVPLVFRDETFGLLAVLESTRTRACAPQDLRTCRALAGHAAVALHNAALFREKDSTSAQVQRTQDTLRRMAQDGLTPCPRHTVRRGRQFVTAAAGPGPLSSGRQARDGGDWRFTRA